MYVSYFSTTYSAHIRSHTHTRPHKAQIQLRSGRATSGRPRPAAHCPPPSGPTSARRPGRGLSRHGPFRPGPAAGACPAIRGRLPTSGRPRRLPGPAPPTRNLAPPPAPSAPALLLPLPTSLTPTASRPRPVLPRPAPARPTPPPLI